MSGVNAHVILAPSRDSGKQTRGPTSGLPWRKAYTWPGPPQHLLLTQVADNPFGIKGSVTLTGVLSRAVLSYLWDHQVLDRALLAGSALFEAAHAAMVHMCEDVNILPVLARAAILAPCVLSDTPQTTFLICQVEEISGHIAVRTTQPHLHGWACRLRSPQSLSPYKQQTWALPFFSLEMESRVAAREPQAAPQLGQISQHMAPCGYCVHPAVGDCTIHMGAVQGTRHPTRVPVSVDAWGCTVPFTVHPSFEWAVAESRGIDPDASARNNMRCCSDMEPVHAQIDGLFAKLLPQKRAAAMANGLGYILQWQTANLARHRDVACLPDAIEVQSSPTAITRGGTLWRFSGKDADGKSLLLRHKGTCTRTSCRPWMSDAMKGMEAAATFQLQQIQVVSPLLYTHLLAICIPKPSLYNASQSLGPVQFQLFPFAQYSSCSESLSPTS